MPNKKTPKQEPSQLIDDKEGSWYIVPESKLMRFHDILNMDYDAAWEAMSEFDDYRIDDIRSIRLLKWKEMS